MSVPGAESSLSLWERAGVRVRSIPTGIAGNHYFHDFAEGNVDSAAGNVEVAPADIEFAGENVTAALPWMDDATLQSLTIAFESETCRASGQAFQ